MNKLREVLLERPKTVVITGVLSLLIAGLFGAGLFSSLATGDEVFFASGTPSQAVNDQLKDKFGVDERSAVLLFESKNKQHAVTSPEYATEVSRLLDEIPDAKITSYYQTGSDQFISKDGFDTYAVVSFEEKDTKKNYQTVMTAVNGMSSDQLKVSAGGLLIGVEDTQEQAKKDLTIAEIISLPILAVLLLLFFRSPVAAAVPLGMSLLTIAGALAIARVVHAFLPVDTYTLNVITILGVGLSVDYSLLSINRFREELAAGRSVKKAAEITIKTAGKTILFSGLTVIVCLLSLLLFPIGFMQAVSVGGTSAVMVAILISTLLIPSALVLLGKNINKWSLKHRTIKKKSKWQAVAELVTRHPARALLGGLAVIGLFVWPLGDAQTTTFSWRTLSSQSPSYYVGKQMEENFSLKTPSLTVMVDFGHEPNVGELCKLSEYLKAHNQVDSVIGAYSPQPQMSCEAMAMAESVKALPPQLTTLAQQYVKGSTATVDLIVHDSAGSKPANDLVRTLRDSKFGGHEMGVAGVAALTYDTHEAYGRWLPVVLAVIAAAMIVLLSLLLGSVVLPIQAIAINSLALLISLGVLVMLFQYGWATSVLHHSPTLGFEPAIPILICVIAFGLSMDYAVFLYSRMHEIYDETGDPDRAIVEGVTKTGPIITAAAIVLFVVVAAFITSRIAVMQQIGVGLAVAVLIDAFFVRIFFVPAVMKLFGKNSWWAPKWLKKLTIRHD